MNNNISESQEVMIQACGALLRKFQEDRGTDHYEFNFKNNLWKIGVGLNGIINIEKHPIEEKDKE